MFRLFPPSSAGGPERNFPARPLTPWLVILIVVTSGWTPIQAALILAVITMVAMLALILRWSPGMA